MARPATLRVVLTAGQRAELQQRLRQRTLSPRLRRRLECIRLADLGWPATQIAAHLGVHEATVRRTVHRLADGGLDGLADRPRSGRPARLNRRDLDAAEELLARAAGQHETWTLARLASWLAQARGAAISPGRLSVLLRQHGCHWTRLARPPGGPSGAPG
jgi:transposase